MKKSLRFISLLIAAVFLISGAVMVVCHAEPAVDQQQGDQGGSQQGDQGGSQQVDQGGSQQVDQGGSQQVDQGSGQSSGGDQSSGQSSGGDQGGYSYDYDSGYTSDYDSGAYSDYSGNVGSVEDNAPITYGNSSNNYVVDSTESAAGSVSSSLYNSSGMSAEDAKPNEWSDITLDEKTVQTGVTDFSSIKENTKEEDNGNWILYLGYILLGLSGLGILYFIIATIAHRNAVKKAERLENRRRNSSSPSHSAAARMEERERLDEYEDEAPRRRRSRYADEDDDLGRSRRGSRSDTGEVYVPRRAAKR